MARTGVYESPDPGLLRPIVKKISAEKFQSCGNDFLVVPWGQVREEEYGSLARAICDRHTGPGADGCLFPREISEGRFALRIFNQDGSEAGMSGNGTRCVAAFLHRNASVEGPRIIFETSSGEKVYTLLEEGNGRWSYRARMGVPRFEPEDVPVTASGEGPSPPQYGIEVEDGELQVTVLSVGNPQCVLFLEDLPRDSEFRRLGAELEHHARFPDRTNVSFVKVVDPSNLRILIWERGVGPTRSSGTGSCGAAVAAIHSGKARSPVRVETPGGTQSVEWAEGEEILLTGEAVVVATLEYFWI